MTNFRINIAQHPNLGMHTYSVDFRLTLRSSPYASEPFPEADMPAFEAALNGLLGVKKARIGKYEVHIEKGDAFDWSDISPRMVAAFKSFYEARTGFSADPTINVDDQRPNYDRDGDDYGEGRKIPLYNEPINEGV